MRATESHEFGGVSNVPFGQFEHYRLDQFEVDFLLVGRGLKETHKKR